MTDTSTEKRRFLFLLASARRNGNSETLARHAAQALSHEQAWLRLSELPLPPFEDIRHQGEGQYAPPIGPARELLEHTLAASDIVWVAPLYWYGLPASAKLYLDHWSGWMRVPGLAFKQRMAGKTMWVISAVSDEDTATADPLLGTLRLSTTYMSMKWGGALLGYANRPGDIELDTKALTNAQSFFTETPTNGEALG